MSDNDLMEGKICLVTGATSGIGKVTAIALARMSAHVVIVGRTIEKCEATIDEIKALTGSQSVEYLVADLSSQKDVYGLAREYKDRHQTLHVLINNAGMNTLKRLTSIDGIELTFATNYLSQFLLTNLLLDTLKASAPSRIINVSSLAHAWAKFDIDHVDSSHGTNAYYVSKFYQVLFTYELARRLEGTSVTANVLNPGYVRTSIGRNTGFFQAKIVMPLSDFFSRAVTPEVGAQTIIYLATSPEVEQVSGKYFSDLKAVPSAPGTEDEQTAARLWTYSEQMITRLAPALSV